MTMTEQPTAANEPGQPKPRIWGCLILLALLAVAAGLGVRHLLASGTQGRAEKKGGPPKAIPVATAVVKRQDVPVQVHVVGSVTAYSTVPVTSQVTGQLVKVLIRQGDYVYAGQPLFTIDSRPQRASLDQAQAVIEKDHAQIAQASAALARDMALIRQAEAAVAKDKALVAQAHSNLARDMAQRPYLRKEHERYQELLSQGFVTAEQADQASTNITALEGTLAADRAAVRAAEATLQADLAALQSARATAVADGANVRSLQATTEADRAAASNAEVQLGYTDIRSPIKGRTGTLNIFEGTVVKANDTNPLITIAQIQPIRVTFAVPERYLQQIRQSEDSRSLTVTAQVPDSKGPPEAGRVNFIENAVDTTTGTITLRADFPNLKRRLWPGQYVNVTLLLRRVSNAVVVPSPAVQPGQQGDYVFVVKPEKTVEVRKVEVDFTYEDLSIIKTGLSEGETVVTDGQLQLTPGAAVVEGGERHRARSPSPEPTSVAPAPSPSAP